jgi:hypothetical protein
MFIENFVIIFAKVRSLNSCCIMKSKILFSNRKMLIEERNKGIVLLLPFFVLLWNGCSDKKQAKDNIYEIDVTRVHSEKLINIDEDIASFEFVPLETDDEFLCAGKVVTFTDEIIIYRNFAGGDILIFDRKGKALKKINRQGLGSEEYINNINSIYDDVNKELFVNCMESGKVVVYDLDGNFKRRFSINNRRVLVEIENYDKNTLICYVRDVEPPVFLVSKQTGEKIRDIIIPYEKKLSTDLRWTEGNEIKDVVVYRKTLIKTGSEFIISEPSSDTIYSLNPQESVLRPILCRTPPVNTMNIPVFLLPTMKAGHFLFLTCMTKEYNFNQRNFPSVNWVYDCRDSKIYDLIFFPKLSGGGNTVYAVHDSRNNVFLWEFSAEKIKEMAETEEQFKEIAANLKEDDNPVIAIIKLKE